MATPSTSSKRRPREQIEISIPLLKRYVRNSGPAQQPISLLPAHDSDAFIIDKVIHPTTAVLDKNVQRRACYIIGWPDLPAARLLISCTRALDYVSPWEMENWEYKDALRREQEEFDKDTEAAVLASMASMPGAAEPAKKRRGRPPRAALQDQPPPTPILGAEDRKLIAQKKAAGPSLSTPQKRRWAELLPEDEEMQEEEDDELDDAILEQLGVEGPETSGPGAQSTPGKGRMLHKPARALPQTPSRWLGEDTDSGESDLASLESYASHSRVGLAGGLRRPNPLGDHHHHHHHHHHPHMPSAKRLKVSPVPSPLTRLSPRLEMDLNRQSSPSESGATSSAASLSEQTRRPRHTNKLRNTPKLKSLMPLQNKQPSSSLRSTPSRSVSAAAPLAGTSRTTPSSATAAPRVVGHKSAPPVWSAIPTAPAADRVSPGHDDITPKPAPASGRGKEKKKRNTTKNNKPQEAQSIDLQESGWEIKGLEGEKLIEEEDGTLVRHFKVRWKGDWPPDQNPTWEPEDNISKSAVRAYLKKRAQHTTGDVSSSVPKKSLKQNTLSPWIGHRKFSSVSEAFEGGEDVEMSEPAQVDDRDAMAVESGDELRVTEGRDNGSPLRRLTGSNLDVSLAQQLRLFNRRS